MLGLVILLAALALSIGVGVLLARTYPADSDDAATLFRFDAATPFQDDAATLGGGLVGWVRRA